MRVYIFASTEGRFQDALRRLGLHERAVVRVRSREDLLNRDGPVYVATEHSLERVAEAPDREQCPGATGYGKGRETRVAAGIST